MTASNAPRSADAFGPLSLADGRDVGAILLTPERQPTFLTDAARRLLNLDAPAASTEDLSIVPLIEEVLNDADQSVGSARRNLPLSGPPPRTLTVEAHALSNAASSHTGYLVIIEDDDRLHGRNRSSQPATATRTRHLYRALAHDLRQSTAAVLLHLDILSEHCRRLDDTESAACSRAVTTIRREVQDLKQSLSMLIGEIAPTESRESFDLATLVTRIAHLVRPQARQQGVALDVATPDGPTPLNVPPRAVKQSLLNLITNALDALPEGGTVSLHLFRTDDVACIAVADDGPGIPAEEQERIFDLRYSTKEDGTGLGLYTVRQTVERLGGSVSVDSSEGAGTRVQVRLPLADAPPLSESGGSPQ